jgi:hypothetical protein
MADIVEYSFLMCMVFLIALLQIYGLLISAKSY